jgi:hypothetical protein
MSMFKLYLTATDKPSMTSALTAWGFVTDDAPKGISLTNVHPVGAIWRTEPIRNAADVVTTPGVTVPGFHVNITCANPDLADACEALVVEAGESKTVNGIYSCHPNSPALRI